MSIKPPSSTQSIGRYDLLEAVRAMPKIFEPTWDRIFRPVRVNKSAGTFGTTEVGDAARDPGQGAGFGPRHNFARLSTRPNEISFSTTLEGVEALYSHTDLANYEDTFNYETYLAEVVWRSMQIRNERRCYSTIFNQTTFPADNVAGMNAGTAWTNSAAVPVDDVSKMLTQILLAGGNPMACVGVCTWETFMVLLGQKQLNDRRASVQVITNLVNDANRAMVASQLGLQDIIVTTMTHNTASDGATASFASAANKNFFGIFQPAVTENNSEFCFGRTYYNVGADGTHVGLGTPMDIYNADEMTRKFRWAQDLQMKVNYPGLFKLIGNVNP